MARSIPAGDPLSSRGQRPPERPSHGKSDPERIDGYSPQAITCPPCPNLCDPYRVLGLISPFPGALPPAIKLRPSRARSGGEVLRRLFSRLYIKLRRYRDLHHRRVVC